MSFSEMGNSVFCYDKMYETYSLSLIWFWRCMLEDAVMLIMEVCAGVVEYACICYWIIKWYYAMKTEHMADFGADMYVTRRR